MSTRNKLKPARDSISPNSRNKRGSASNNMQHDVNCELNDLVAEVLDSKEGIVKVGQARLMVKIMTKHFKFFKTAYIGLLDKILVLEERDQFIRKLYTLCGMFYQELKATYQKLNPGKFYFHLYFFS